MTDYLLTIKVKVGASGMEAASDRIKEVLAKAPELQVTSIHIRKAKPTD